MNVLDENVPVEQRTALHTWGIAARQIGYDVGRLSMQDDEIISLLHKLRHSTFFTLDLDFYKRYRCHSGYCLVFMDVEPNTVAAYVRLLLNHSDLNTAARRMGTVIRITPDGLTLWRLHSEAEVRLAWSERSR
jgi:hypothetical protein